MVRCIKLGVSLYLNPDVIPPVSKNLRYPVPVSERNSMAMGKGTRAAMIVVAVAVIAVVAYAAVPYVVTTKVANLKQDQVAYIYGTVEKRVAFGNVSAFDLNDSSGTILVVWNGTLPTDGEKVLIHGTYKQSSFLVLDYSLFEASSVTPWLF